MREPVEYRVPQLSRDLIKELATNFPAVTCEEIVTLDPRKLAFKAGIRFIVDTLLEGQAADDADEKAADENQGRLNV